MFESSLYEKISATKRIHPAVYEATAEELIAAGWGEVERPYIPSDWKTRRGPDHGFKSKRGPVQRPGPWDWFLEPEKSKAAALAPDTERTDPV